MNLLKFYFLAHLYLITSLGAFGQSPPADLANLSLGDLLNAKIIRNQTTGLGQVENSSDRTNFLKGTAKSSPLHFVLSYIDVEFDGYKDGTSNLSISDLLWDGPGSDELRTVDNFPVVPTVIRQKVTQLKGAFDISDQFSVSLSIPYIRQETEHVSIVDGFDDFLIISEGIGDIEAVVSWFKQIDQNNNLLLNLGLTCPTGSIDEKGRTPRDALKDTQLPYTMQLGSGTFDIKPSIMYTGKTGAWSYGGNLSLTLRTSENSRDYRLGNVYQGDMWTRYALTGWIQPSIRVNAIAWDHIHGQDDEITVPGSFPYPAAVTNPHYFGGEKVLAQFGLRLSDPNGGLNNSFIDIEAGVPVYEDLNGPQPSEKWRISANIVFNF